MLNYKLIDMLETAIALDFQFTDIEEFIHSHSKEILYNTLINFSPDVLKKLPEGYEASALSEQSD